MERLASASASADEAVYLDAVQYAQQHKQLIHTTVVDNMPPDSKLAAPN